MLCNPQLIIKCMDTHTHILCVFDVSSGLSPAVSQALSGECCQVPIKVSRSPLGQGLGMCVACIGAAFLTFHATRPSSTDPRLIIINPRATHHKMP